MLTRMSIEVDHCNQQACGSAPSERWPGWHRWRECRQEAGVTGPGNPWRSRRPAPASGGQDGTARVKLAKKVFAIEIDWRAGRHGDVPIDPRLAGQPHGLFVANVGH